MNDAVKMILGKNPTDSSSSKLQQLKKLEKDIELAKKVLNNEWSYCVDCDDYYLTNSFISSSEEKEVDECIYQDPINSGGNEYKRVKYRFIYSTCPKGHKKVAWKTETMSSIYDD